MSKTQTQAANPQYSTWLSAHAGTGKTKVLVDRVLRLLLLGEPPSSIVCITYTKAAAMEMQLRIRKMLRKWVREEETVLRNELEILMESPVNDDLVALARSLLCRLMEDQSGVRVTTIHSFCQSILARFPIEAGIAPHFQLLDDRSADELLLEAKQRLLSKAAYEKTALLLRQSLEYVACRVGDGSFQDLSDELLRQHLALSAMLRTKESPARIIQNIYATLDVAVGESEPQLFANILRYDAQALATLREACHVLLDGSTNMKKLGKAIDEWLFHGSSFEGFEKYSSAFLTDKGEPYKIPSFYTSALTKSRPDLAEFLDGEQKRVYQLSKKLADLDVAKFSEAVVVIAEALIALYRVLKEERSAVDYDDLIAHTLGLFAQEGMAAWVMSKMDQQCRHIMLDEAQDTSPQQWLLAQHLVEGFLMDFATEAGLRSLFVVGDEKQSIYRFQGAAPELFRDSQEYYSDYFKQSGMGFQSLALDCSFRSTQAVLNVVDSTFNANGFIDKHSEPLRHDVFRKGQAGCVELWPLLEKPEVESRIAWSADEPSYMQSSAASELCDQIVAKLSLWLTSGRMLASKGRAVEAGDILILLRNRKPMASLLIGKLKRAGIAVAGADRIKLNEHLAVQDILSIARWCLLISDDLALAETLKGPWFALNEQALFDLAYDRGDQSLWQRVQQCNPQIYTQLIEIRSKALTLPPHEWLMYLMDQLEGRRRCKERFGDEVDELFDELLHQSVQFESSHMPVLQSFVAWLCVSDNEIKREMEQAGSAVRVMTVHGAKGLQAPIVIVPTHTKAPRVTYPSVWRQGDSLENWTVLCEPTGVKSGYVDLLKNHKKEQDRLEEQRLLYVAMTRAEDELYVCGIASQKNASADSWYEQVRLGMLAAPDCQKEDDGTLRVECMQTAALDTKTNQQEVYNPPQLPAWFDRSAHKEHVSKPLSPSTSYRGDAQDYDTQISGEDGELARIRGTALHALLEYMPQITTPNIAATLKRLAQLRVPADSDIDVDALVHEAVRIHQDPQFDFLFLPQSLAEVSLKGSIRCANGVLLDFSGQIDRLIVSDDEVHIVDFKSNRNPPHLVKDVPRAYIHQLWVYRELLKQRFPQHNIVTSLLWTAVPQLMIIDTMQLDEYGQWALDSLAA